MAPHLTGGVCAGFAARSSHEMATMYYDKDADLNLIRQKKVRSEEHTSELQSH